MTSSRLRRREYANSAMIKIMEEFKDLMIYHDRELVREISFYSKVLFFNGVNDLQLVLNQMLRAARTDGITFCNGHAEPRIEESPVRSDGDRTQTVEVEAYADISSAESSMEEEENPDPIVVDVSAEATVEISPIIEINQ